MHPGPEKMLGIIYNPMSRKGFNRHRVEDIRRILDEHNFPYEYRETECPLDGIRVAREMSETCDTIVSVGGDGTLFEVVNGAHDKGVTFGILPFGSGNDVSRSLHVYKKSDEELADMLMNPKVRTVDSGVYDGKVFLLFVSFGIVADIIKAYMGLKKAGRSGYARAVLKAVFHHKPKNYHIKLPDREFDCYADFVAIQNVPTAGGGLYTNGLGVDNDGHLDLVIINHVGRIRLVRNAIALFRGKLHKQKNVDVIPVTTIDVDLGEKRIGSLDGELVEYEKVHVEMGEPIKFLH